jgi:signal transduction histidine kinase
VPEARDEVHSLAVTLNDMLSRLATAQQRQRQFVSDTAHELRSPIASMRAQLEVALDHPDSQEWEQTARDVLADTLRLSRLAEDLLALARLEEGGGPARGAGSPVDLAALVQEIPCGYSPAKVAVVADAPAPCPVSGDPDALRRMLVNLVDNAVRYASSRVTVAARPAGDAVLVTVTDDGPGIPAVQAERAFERFTTLDDARARPDDEVSGAGLGLAIVRATAHAHGGRAWLEDAGPGLRAAVRLPAGAAGDYRV